MIYNNIVELIGNTPLFKIDFKEENIADVYVKLEKFNIGGSVKDRAVLGMLEDAQKKGLIKPGDTLIEATSGNTGISLALVGSTLGYRVIIVMPETMTVERRAILHALGAELILTDGTLGTKGSIDKVEEIKAENPNYFIPSQFSNGANPYKHYETTAVEILKELNDVDVFVTGVGSAGTLTGVARRFKKDSPNTKIYAVEPEASAVLSGNEPGKHAIAGIGAGFIPDNFDRSLIDGIIQITDEEAIEFTRKLSREFGLFLGISSGANIKAAYKLAKELGKGKKVVTVAPDGGERYLSVAPYKYKEEE